MDEVGERVDGTVADPAAEAAAESAAISAANPVTESAHYGTKPGHFKTSIIHLPTSEGVSEVSERANE